MINEIVSGISVKLSAEFGDSYRIYTETVKQNLSEPCFFIQLLDFKMKPLINQRYKLESSFCIQYFPESNNMPFSECRSILERMNFSLEYIMDNALRGINIFSEINDSTLLFYVKYNMLIKKEERTRIMKDLQMKLKTKG